LARRTPSAGRVGSELLVLSGTLYGTDPRDGGWIVLGSPANIDSGHRGGRVDRQGDGLQEGRAIRVLPFGYVADGEAANPAAPLDVALTVGAEGIVRELAVSWGTRESA
jgi:hypothetical protein